MGLLFDRLAALTRPVSMFVTTRQSRTTTQVLFFLDRHCNKSIRCSNQGYVDQNCRCVCPDGSSDCEEGKDQQFQCRLRLMYSHYIESKHVYHKGLMLLYDTSMNTISNLMSKNILYMQIH